MLLLLVICTGNPIILDDDVIPGPKMGYPSETRRAYTSTAKQQKPQKHLTFLNTGPHLQTIERLRNKGYYLITIRKCTMTGGQNWDNHAQCKWVYFIHYCVNEGITRTLQIARSVMLYVFYGHYFSNKERLIPVSRALHLATTNPRRR